LNAREARGKEAVGDLVQIMRDGMLEIRLAPRRPNDTVLPLGWILSDQAMTAIDRAIRKPKPGDPIPISGNQAAIAALQKLIASGIRPPVACDNAQCGDKNAEKGSAYNN
jgi:hypothetical protein